MHIYRCFFLGEDDHIKAAEIIEADVIGEAVHKALVVLRERPEHRTVELVDKIIQMIPTAFEDFREVWPCCEDTKRQICTTRGGRTKTLPGG